MQTLTVHLFKDSFGPFISLLNESDIKYSMREYRSGAPVASSGAIELLTTPALWEALACVVVTFLTTSHGRKVIITTKDNTVIQAEGLTKKELEQVLSQTKTLAAIDTGKQPDS